MSDNIKVVVKVRPLIQREISEKLSYQWRINNNTLYQIGQHGKETGQYFTFEKVYDQYSKTKNVYDDVAKPIVEAAIAGINGTIFAYGQTSSGKTYTMSGSEELPGIIQLAVYDLFNIIKNTPDRDFCVKASYIEIYNESLKDLLDVENKNIKIKETFQGVKVNATELEAKTPEEVLNIMKIGEANRHVGATNMNEESSRSHSIFQITITSKERIEDDDETGCVNMSQLNLVDLAGSERSGQTGATGQRFKEGTHINKSLSVLALVIKQLSEDPNRFINYRDSKLTRLLQNSLGGNAKTSIICAVTPAAIDETISTLQFANRAKAITNNPEVNAVVTDRTTIQTLTNQLARLQSQLEGKKNLEQDNYNLNKQIAALQRLITSDLVHRDSGGNERRKGASRRATIAGHSFDAPDPVPFAASSFRTPLFKYNINTTPFSMESTMSTSSRLPIVDEETIGEHSTLKKQERKIDFNDEIITIDSDGEESFKSNDCSPSHKCYENSKTPPCVLRKNVRLVEKELKDIIDFTELEKQYPPEVVELTRDLQVKRDTILQLEEQINVLNEKDKDNKAKIEELIQKLEQSEQNVESMTKTKDTINAELNTKITDLEVSYETLKKKANVREEELLSLIKEQQSVRTKALESETVNFLNISKDLSLVNTDSDDSVDSLTEPTKHSDRRAEDLKSLEQLKKQIIVASREEIEMLKNENSSLKTNIEVFKGNVETLVNENSLMKTEIEKLNASLNNQKESLHEEIEYYNRVICNLHGKLGDMQLIRIEEIFIKNLFNNRLNEFKTKFTEIVTKVNNLIEFNQKTCIDSANSIENLNEKIADLEIAIETKNQTIDELNIQIEDLIKQKSSLTKDNENVNSELKNKNEKLKELELQLVESNSNYSRLRGEILSRDEQITSLKEKEKTISFEMKSLVLEKDNHISNIKLKLREIQESLENETKSHNDIVKTKTNDIALLNNKLKNLEKLLDEKEDQLIDLTNNVYDSTEDSVIEVPLQLLTFVGDLITSLKQNMFYDHIDKKISHEESEKRNLSETVSQLQEADHLITTSNLTINEKLGEIEKAMERVKKFKDTMIKNENLYKEKIEELQIENKALQTRFDELKNDLSKTKDCDELKKSVENLPHSLLSLCTNVINRFQFNKDNSEGIFNNRDMNSTYCQGEHQYTPEFYRQQISELNSTITELKFENSKLLDEQVMNRNEVQSLVESIKTLNKKILQHKTALLTKVATSFAENKLLKSQIRAAEHNYARIFSMINKDLPWLKEKLTSLRTLLHDDHPYDIGVTDLLACSLYGKSDTKNESTIDGDLLMLDTNITLTTVNDTLTNHDQTCFESTQILCDNEVVDEPNQASEINIGTCSETTTTRYYDANDKIEIDIKNINESNRNEELESCENCSRTNELKSELDKITKEMEQILKDQSEIKLQKNDIEKKYIAKTQEAGDLTEKLNNIVKECNYKSQEVENLKKSLNSKNNTLKELQFENDTLSTQLMENISEVEDSKKEIELLLEKNKKLKETCENVMTVTSDKNHETGSTFILHSKINRRHSDSASASRCNKICTLRNELNAGRDVCKELTENIASIKSELDHSAMNIISDAVGTENFDNGTNSSSLPSVPEESQEIYLLDKSLCSDYYIEKTGAQIKNICHDSKIIDIMKMLYTDITAKHANEIENLNNKLKSDNESMTFFKIQLSELRSKLAEITRELEDKNIFVETTQNSLSVLRKYANDVKTNISKLNTNEHDQMTLMLNELLQKLDVEFDLSTSEIFEGISALLSKTQSGLIDSGEKYECLLRLSETLNIEVNDLKVKLNNKSSEYNTLEAKLEKTKEIASAVTLDLIGRERLLHNVIVEKYKTMVEQNIVGSEEISLLQPLNTVVEKMLEKTLTALEAQKQAFDNNNHLLEEMRAEATMLKSEKEQLSEINVALSTDAEDIKSELVKQIRLHEELQELYTRKSQENESNIELLKQLKEKTEEIKQSFAEKEQSFNETVLATNVKVADLSKTIEELKLENVNLKTIYDVVKKEKESCRVELEKSCNTIKKHNDEIEKLTSDILVLRESIKDNCSVRENLKMEVKSLIEQNKSLTEQIEQRTLECSRLETNIKTHEKSLQIQSGIILRLQKEKDESVNALVEKEKIIENLSKDCTTKQNEFHILKSHNVELQNEIVGLQAQLGREPSKEEQPARPSLVCSRRRRQSCHDANRMLPTATPQEENKFEELLSSRNVPDDLFADKEDDDSSRSTPIRFSLGRENTCKQEESPPPRPSSVKEIRKRRQSMHDHNRTVNVSHGAENLKSKLSSTIPDGDADLKELLAYYRSEIEELKQQNKELDEECETCATYLREREDQCSRLGKEKKDLQNQVTELRKQLRSFNPSEQSKLHDVAVNTDEDWTNLHSVVVDRLSYDVEVDKNKKLTRALDDFRVRNHELKAAVTKLQNKLQKNQSEGHTKTTKELEAVKLELESCNQIVSELRKRCKEMQADCETQNAFIREKDREIEILRDTSVALEAKLKEFNTQQQELHQMKLNMFQVSQQKALLEQQLISMTAAAPLYVAAGSAIVQNQQMSDIMKENQKLKTVNAKLMSICKKRTKANRENDEPSD